MKSKIWIPCVLVIVMTLALLLWPRTTPTESATKDTNAPKEESRTGVAPVADSRTGVPSVASSQGRSDFPVATGAGGIAHGQDSADRTANLRQQDARATTTGRDGRSTGPVVVEPLAIDLTDTATATIRVGDQVFEERSNEYGVFNEVRIRPSQQVSIAVTFAQGDPGQRVVAMEEDGGILRDGERVLPMQLDAHRSVAFDFTAEDTRGVYRIRLRRGTDTKMVQFWAGEPLALAAQ